jgi:hypothetical protein
MALDLYHHGSSACAAKVRFALAEKALPWTSHYVDILRGEQFKPEYLALNPKGVVPTLVHDGAVIVESTVICEYVDEAFPEQPAILGCHRSTLERRRLTASPAGGPGKRLMPRDGFSSLRGAQQAIIPPFEAPRGWLWCRFP